MKGYVERGTHDSEYYLAHRERLKSKWEKKGKENLLFHLIYLWYLVQHQPTRFLLHKVEDDVTNEKRGEP